MDVYRNQAPVTIDKSRCNESPYETVLAKIPFKAPPRYYQIT